MSVEVDLREYYRDMLGEKRTVEIDLNVRVGHGLTFVGYDDCTPTLPSVGESVEATCGGLCFPAIVTHLDSVKQLVYLAVAWREDYS